ncbi:hypothetical protein WR25_12082 isoform D [Diploscapter pachys]|uniref:WW domain-containing protein n=1 Tax=Diploscapter pachys TaxID=2018661 RepID=A0A2A2K064_9BILA|nr:hypothetical protein WR25_12082 isoform D [Diploscapter pachys]
MNLDLQVIEKVETRRAEVEERHRVTTAAANKIGIAEATLIRIEAELADIEKDSRGLREVIQALELTRHKLAANETERKEAERAAEKMLTLEDNVPEQVVNSTRTRIRSLAEKSKGLAEKIEDELSCARKEHRRTLQKAISDEERLLEKLQQCIEASEKATDAEEFCEHLDALESLLEKVTVQSVELEQATADMDEPFQRENVAKLAANKEKMTAKARDRVVALTKAVEECEKFERSMAELQKWAAHMGPLLSSRRASDITASDVPQEYREISKEFKKWEETLADLNKWLNEGERRDNERLRAQYEHATITFNELRTKFNEFKQPKTFEEKLERTTAKLNSIENSIDELTGIKASDAGDGAVIAGRIARDLKEIDEDLKSLLQGNEKLKEEGIIDKLTAKDIQHKIQQHRRNTKELGIRAEEAVERLEDCSEMWKRCREEAAEMDLWLDKMENKLGEYEREEATANEGAVESMMAEWNRNEAAIKSIDQLESTLKEKGVSIDSVYMERRQRADALKRRLDNWNLAQREMEEDDEDLLLQVDQLQAKISGKLDKLEDKPVEEIARTLSLLRNDRDRLSSRARRLAARNPRLAHTKPMDDIQNKWKELEGKLHEVTPIFTPPSAELDESSPFADKVSQLSKKFEAASRLFDFDSSPVESPSTYKQRAAAIESFLALSKPTFDRVLKEGRRLADSGRMELSTHKAIEQLDEIADQVDRLEEQCEMHNDKADTLEHQHETLVADVGRMEEVLDKLLARDLNDAKIAEATRKDLLERDTQLTDISSRAAQIHQQLPGKSGLTRDATLDRMNEKISRLEEKLAKTEADRQKSEQTQGQVDSFYRLSPDRVSMGSSAPLAMEAYTTGGSTTEEESTVRYYEPIKMLTAGTSSEKDTSAPSTSPVPAERRKKTRKEEEERPIEVKRVEQIETEPEIIMTKSMGVDPMEKVYADLDEIEESIAYNEEFPMENVTGMTEKFAGMRKALKEAEKKIEENEMTLDMLHVEHTRERIESLEKDIEARMERNRRHIQEWNEADRAIEEADRQVTEAEHMPFDREAESTMRDCEQKVCNAVRHQASILNRLEENGETATALKDRVKGIEERYRNVLRRMKEVQQKEQAERIDEQGLRQAVRKIDKWKNEMVTLEAAKDLFIEQKDASKDAKHDIRRGVSEAAKRVADIRSDLGDRRSRIEKQRTECEVFWLQIEQIGKETGQMNQAMNRMQEAVLYTPASIPAIREQADRLRDQVDLVKARVKAANERHPKLAGRNARKVVEVLTQAAAAIARAFNLREIEVAQNTNGHHINTHDSDSHSKSKSSTIDRIPERSAVQGKENGFRTATDEDTTADVIEEIGRLESESRSEKEAERRMRRGLDRIDRDSEETSQQPQLSARDEAHNQMMTNMKHWMTEMERDAGMTVDLAESQQIRQMSHTVHNIAEQMKRKIMEVVAIEDSSADRGVKMKAHELAATMDRILKQCERRRNQLNVMAAETRQNETDRAEMELWLREAEQIAEGAGKQMSAAASVDAVREELQAVEKIISDLDERKILMANINAKGNQLLDNYPKDEAHNLSHQLSRLNMRWTKFNDTIRVRRAVLDASLRSRSDFHTALSEFEDWLSRMRDEVENLEEKTDNMQAMKDTANRKECMQHSRNITAELNAHENVYKAVDDMGRKLVAGFESNKERNDMQSRIDRLNHNWNSVKESSKTVRDRLEKAEQEWEKLTDTLAELNSWVEEKSAQTIAQQPVGGSLSAVMQQSNWIKQTQRDMEAKSPLVKETITAAHSYLMQHDLRPKMHRPAVLDEDEQEEARDAEQRRCGLQIHADCEKLKETWAELGLQIGEWDRLVQDASGKLQELERALAECQLHLSSAEGELEGMRPVEKLRLEELKDARTETEDIAKKVDTVRLHVDDANDSCGRLLAADMRLDSHIRSQIDAVNHRFHSLKTNLRIRAAALRNALTDFGPSSEHFLNQSVELPWQRAISKTNQLPYYIDHTTERTQWEHPVWVEMCKELSQFNRVKFIAYRTAMKLRALQKRLCLDLTTLDMLDKAFHRLAGLSAEESPTLEDMVSCLLPLFEQIHHKHPQLVRSVALAVDLCINFILNLFDPTRDGVLRLLSFKIALVVFCNSELEEKYKYLFDLVAQQSHANQKQVALLLYDLIHIPRLVGEAAAFGGSNVEPSVRSCFESVRMAQSISSSAFLDWVKKEPQSIVWLPVMHRLATAEFAKHQAKCNVCKMFPIVGLRYRCLYCFNLDLCQNCFFSQRTAKKHKLKHAMQEYATPTTSGEDARDFAKMVRNKLRRSKNSLGYLPVDVAEEGLPIVSAPCVHQNPSTEPLHARTAVISARLAELTVNQVAEPRDHLSASSTTQNVHSDIKSPLQIINQVEQMQKDELDQLLHRLQLENLELKMELERKKSAAQSTPDLDKTPNGAALSSGGRRSEGRGATLPRLSNAQHGRSVPSLKSTQSQYDVLDEARALRLHKQRLEHRSRILEQQNQQLEMQLTRLRRVIDLQNNGAPQGEIKWNGHRVEDWEREQHSQPPMERNTFSPAYGMQMPDPSLPLTPDWEEDAAAARSTRMQSLLATADDLNRAFENLVVSVVYDSDKE